MRLTLISFLTAFSIFAVISVTYPMVEPAIAAEAEREGVPGRRQSGGTR